MGAERGWLGWLRARYEITPDRVTVTRSWWPALLIPLLLAGVVGMVISVDALGARATTTQIAMFVASPALIVLGIIGVIFTPLFGPRAIMCTREGVQIGRAWIERADVAWIQVQLAEQRGKGGSTYTVYLAVQSKYVVDAFAMTILWSHDRSQLRLREIAAAMERLVGASFMHPVGDDGVVRIPGLHT